MSFSQRDPVSDLNPLPTRQAGNPSSPDGSSIDQVGTTMSKFTDGFNNTGDTAPDPARWDVLRQTGITMAVAAGALAITVPTTSGAELLLVGKVGSTIPANLMATLSATVRNVNTQVRVGYLAVDATTGAPIPGATIPTDFAHRANVNYGTNATVTNVGMETVSSSSAVKLVQLTGQVTTAANHEVSIELRAEDVTVATATADSIVGRIAGGRISSQVPSPSLVYRPFIWIVNTAVTVASVWSFQRVVSMDIQELQAEVGGGRGNAAASQGVPVSLIGGSASVTNTAGPANLVVTVGNATVSTLTNASLVHKLVSAATTNATLVKATAGKVVGGSLANRTASWKFAKFFNKATAPVPGTDTPLFTLAVAPNVTLDLAAVFDQYGASFATGIGYCLTGADADLDTTALAASDMSVLLFYA